MGAAKAKPDKRKFRWHRSKGQAEPSGTGQRPLHRKQRRLLNRAVIELPGKRAGAVGLYDEVIARLDPVERPSECPHGAVRDNVPLELLRGCIAQCGEHRL